MTRLCVYMCVCVCVCACVCVCVCVCKSHLLTPANVLCSLFSQATLSPSIIFEECDIQLYRHMDGVRDDLTIHEKAVLELLKKEQV